MRSFHAASVLCLLAIAAGPAAAGTVEVAASDPMHFIDAGATRRDAQDNVDRLSAYLKALGQRELPADQVLQVEFLDLDLAGNVRPSRRGSNELRILKGGADWPRIKLRYTLRSAGQTLASGEESISDMNYLDAAVHGSDRSEPLYFEKRLLATWFHQRLVEHRPAGG